MVLGELYPLSLRGDEKNIGGHGIGGVVSPFFEVR
jgi:hypothetical protein